jgi:hypothetical protein
VKKVIANANGTALPCHRQSQLICFSPEEHRIVAEKWEQYQGKDPPVRQESYMAMLMQEAMGPSALEKLAVNLQGGQSANYSDKPISKPK